MKNFSKPALLLILLAIFIITAGFFAYQWWQIKGELAKQIEENANLVKQIYELQREIEGLKVSKEEIEEGIKEETTGWKTYRNEEYGFEVKYPKDWYIYDEDLSKVYFQKRKEEEIGFETQPFGPHSLAVEIAVIENPFNLTPKEWAIKELLNSVDIESEEEILIGGMPGIKIICSYGEAGIGGEFPIVYTGKNLKIYRFDPQISGEPEIFNQILSTFKFIEE